MLSELLLVLAGHPSSFFIPSPPPPALPATLALSPALADLLHPGEAVALGALAHLAFNYRKVRSWAESVQQRGRQAVLEAAISRKGKEREAGGSEPGVYLATLAGSVLAVLNEYDVLVVETETRVLQLDDHLVEDDTGYVPLSTLLATFDRWQVPLESLAAFVDALATDPGHALVTPGRLMHEVAERTQTGHPKLAAIYTSLLDSLRHLFLTHVVAFLLAGVAPAESTPTAPSIALDTGADPLSSKHRTYALNADLFPPSVARRTRESMLYVGRVAATLRREGKQLPKTLVDSARADVTSVTGLDDDGGLDEAVQRVREEVGEWLWKHILTGPQVVEAIDAFGNYFLTRDAEYTLAVIRELGELRLTRIVMANPRSSTAVIREQDVNLALLRASVGTPAESDRALDRLRWKMPRGSLRPAARAAPEPAAASSSSPVRDLFSSLALGTPLELSTTVSWPLDLFMTAPAVAAYADMHAYLFALRDTHVRVLACWTSLSASQRRRRKYTGATEGGTRDEAAQRRALARTAWAAVRAMLFFLDQLQSHFMTDIIDVQHRRLLEQLGALATPPGVRASASAAALAGSMRSGRVTTSPAHSRPGSIPATPTTPASPAFDTQTVHTAHSARSRGPPPSRPGAHAAYMDFLTLRQVHARHLAFLRDGLLLSDMATATLVRDILVLCTRFAGLVERWGGDVVPELLLEGDAAEILAERQRGVAEIDEALREALSDFFRILADSQDPHGARERSRADGTSVVEPGNVSASRSRAALFASRSRNMSFAARGASASFGKKAAATSRERDERALEAEAVMGRHVEQREF